MDQLAEAPRLTPVADAVDVCVVGGSVTGVCAAVAAARLGCRTALIEAAGMLGGNTTQGLVAVWHSFWDVSGSRQVIAGISAELVRRLQARGAVNERPATDSNWQYGLNPAEMAIELDRFAEEHGVRVFLHARVCAAQGAAGRVDALAFEDPSGRRALRARFVVDASGDAVVVRLAGGATWAGPELQPPTTAALIHGLDGVRRAQPGFNLARTVYDPADPEALRCGFLWSYRLPGGDDLELVFGTRAHGADCAAVDGLTAAEQEGRRQVGRMVGVLRRRFPDQPLRLVGLPGRTGIRETRHATCLHRLAERELLAGTRFPDAIANSCYRVDIHHAGGEGLTFRYLDGREVVLGSSGVRSEGRWRPAQAEDPSFYQIPYRSLVPQGFANLLVAGRCLDADAGAFGAVRVQVTCNQMGEAAGTAAALALRAGRAASELDANELRAVLASHGAAVL